MIEPWITEASIMYYQAHENWEKYKDTVELRFVYAGKASALYELLDKFGAKPEIPNMQC